MNTISSAGESFGHKLHDEVTGASIAFMILFGEKISLFYL
jgi:hypothetical protein